MKKADRSFFGFLSRKRFMLVGISMCVLLLFVQSMISYFMMLGESRNESERWSQTILQSGVETIQTAFRESMQLARQLSKNEELQSHLSSFADADGSFERQDKHQQIRSFLLRYMTSHQDISNLSLWFSSQWLSAKYMPSNLSNYRLHKTIGKPGDEGSITIYFGQQASHPLILELDDYLPDKTKVKLLVEMHSDWLSSRLHPHMRLIVRTMDGSQVLYGSPAGLEETHTIVDEQLGLLYAIRKESLENSKSFMASRNTIFISFVCCSLLSVFLSLATSRRIYRPVEALLDHKFKNGLDDLSRTETKESLSVTLMRYLVLVTVMPIVLHAALCYTASKKASNDVVGNAARQYTAQVAHAFELRRNHLSQTLLNHSIDPFVQRALHEAEGAIVDETTKSQLYQRFIDQEDQFHVTLFDKHGHQVFSTRHTASPLAARLAKDTLDHNIPFAQWRVFGERIVLGRSIRDDKGAFTQQFGILGFILMEMPISLPFSSLSSPTGIDGIAIVSDADEALWQSQSLDATTLETAADVLRDRQFSLLEGGRMFARYPLQSIDWSLLFVVRQQLLIDNMSDVTMVGSIIILLSLLAVLALSFVMSFRFSKAIGRLQYNIYRQKTGTPEDVTEGIQDNEIVFIAHTLNQAIKDSYQEKLLRMEHENKLKSSELMALQAQINPHFLYNTLEAINSVIREGKKTEATKMVKHLSALFNTAMDASDPFVYLQEEVESAQEFEALLFYRYGERVQIAWHIHEDSHRCQVPKLILQPLIENAVLHGWTEKPEVLKITVSSWIEGEDLLIELFNDGKQMSEEEALQTKSLLAHPDQSRKIGLVNVHRRLFLYYGAPYGASISNEPGKGVRVVLRMPCRIKNNLVAEGEPG